MALEMRSKPGVLMVTVAELLVTSSSAGPLMVHVEVKIRPASRSRGGVVSGSLPMMPIHTLPPLLPGRLGMTTPTWVAAESPTPPSTHCCTGAQPPAVGFWGSSVGEDPIAPR